MVLWLVFIRVPFRPPRQVETKGPQPQSDGTKAASGILVVSMAAGSLELSLNGHPMQVDKLAIQLADELKKRPADSRAVFIKAPKRALYREVVRIIDLAKGAG